MQPGNEFEIGKYILEVLLKKAGTFDAVPAFSDYSKINLVERS